MSMKELAHNPEQLQRSHAALPLTYNLWKSSLLFQNIKEWWEVKFMYVL